MSAKTSNKITENIISRLLSDDTQTIIDTLEDVKEKGNAQLIPTLVRLLHSTNPLIKAPLLEILNQLKDKTCLEPLMLQIESTDNNSIKHILLSAIWQSGLSAEKYLTQIVNNVITGDMQTCIECYSVIESFDHSPSINDLSESIVKLKSHLSKEKDKDLLIVGIIEVLQGYLIEE